MGLVPRLRIRPRAVAHVLRGPVRVGTESYVSASPARYQHHGAVEAAHPDPLLLTTMTETTPPLATHSNPGPGRQRQAEVFVGGAQGKAPPVPADFGRLRAAAKAAMSDEAYAYFAGSAGHESTAEANRAAFERWRIVPRMLAGAHGRDLGVTLFGKRYLTPLLLAPIGVLELAHESADLAVAKAAASEAVPYIFSSQASVPMEACARAMAAIAESTGAGAPRWFQLYWSTHDELVASFVRRAEACGCDALVLTLDTTLLGWRPRDLDLAYLPFLRGKGIAQYTSDPVFRAHLAGDDLPPSTAPDPRPTPEALRTLAAQVRKFPGEGGFLAKLRSGEPRAAVQRFVATYSRPSLAWDDLSRLRDLTNLPIVLKGILHPDDAREAVKRGMDGLIVSNHGGRQVDGALAALGALPDVAAAVAGAIPVLMDSGVRGGADVVKALALGAAAVCIGRPYAYGLAAAGEEGVRAVLRNTVADLDLTLGLCGVARAEACSPEMLRRV